MPKAILKLSGISKTFGESMVLNAVDFEFYEGEIHAVIGENGAGKSTLVKILSGLYKKDSGDIYIDGKEVNINNPLDSINFGIATVQQDPFLFEHFTISENIFVEDIPLKYNKLEIIDRKKMYHEAQKILDSIDFPLKSDRLVSSLNLGQKRVVELARVIRKNARIIILDEPIASITDVESKSIINILNKLKSKGISIIYISQKLDDIIKTCDKISILRDGKVAGCMSSKSTDFHHLARMVLGDCLSERYPKLNVNKGEEVFAVENLNSGNFLRNIGFSLRKGEILGITGLVGSGRTRLAKVIFGVEKKDSGTFYVDRLKANINSPKDAIDLGFAYVTEDRFSEGLFRNLDLLKNVFSVNDSDYNSFFINKKLENQLYSKYLKKVNLNLESNSHKKNVMSLSGGNQQKIILLRWFVTTAKIFIFDEPTRGLDISSKVDLYNIMNNLTRKGGSIILISSDIEELIGMCDNVIVMSNGFIVAKLPKSQIDSETIYSYANCNFSNEIG